MLSLRAVATLLVLALVGVEGALLMQGARARGGPGIVVAPADTRVPAPAIADTRSIEPAFLAHMTADDVARGVYALAAQEGAVALTDAQRGTIGPLLREGAELRARLGGLRGARRGAREAWMIDGTGLVAALGPDRTALLAPKSASPSGPPPHPGPR